MAGLPRPSWTLPSLVLLYFLLPQVDQNVVADASANSSSVESIAGLAKSMFPKGFRFGAGSAAFQVEGAVKDDGRGTSIWDTFTHTPGKIRGNGNGDVAVDQYHKYKIDIGILKDMGMDAYRFSLSWTRILPKGKGEVNAKGIYHYSKLIDYLIANGITPYVTLFHWDTPQALEEEYGGFLSKRIVDDFRAYADVCFKEFGDRVKYWATMNEPWTVCRNGYDYGIHAPGRCSAPFGNCTAGNSTTEPYIVAHNLLLSHSAAVKLYRTKYQAKQKGQIGIVQATNMAVPFSSKDKDAADRANEFNTGWFMDPIAKGDYPESMKNMVKERLPRFTKEESEDLKGSFDWIGLNYYITVWAVNNPAPGHPTDFILDPHANVTYVVKGVYMGTPEGDDAFRQNPRGLRKMINYIKTRYNNPPMYLTETGYAFDDDGSMPLKEALNDTGRVEYHKAHLTQALLAVKKDGANLKGYMAWALTDDFEWDSGFVVRFGLVYVDYKNHLRRHPKASARFFKYFLHH
eukprot:TRINITY_DN510_c0_g1_i1.p1 TRINITY_DN510_c0_g1~~TRINITY_DN510_c0_g1_i1.p1  ORF type:complete len:587 (-),score=56.42 TRINITY_DN510_c0_g1_i1:117-1664(-)